MSCTDPPLTTVRQPIEAIGRAAVEILVGQIEGAQPSAEELFFEPEIVARGSTATRPYGRSPSRNRAVGDLRKVSQVSQKIANCSLDSCNPMTVVPTSPRMDEIATIGTTPQRRRSPLREAPQSVVTARGGATPSSTRSTSAASPTGTATASATSPASAPGCRTCSELGVDALWFNPWYPSPLADNGYDIVDYRAIDPDFGTLAEAEELIARRARARHPHDRRRRPEPRLERAPVVPRGARGRAGFAGTLAILVPARTRRGRERAAERLAVDLRRLGLDARRRTASGTCTSSPRSSPT